MGKLARRLFGLIVVVGVGCSFDSAGSGGDNALGSSAVDDATSSAASETQSSDAAGEGEGSTSFVGGSTSVGNDEACVDTCAPTIPGGWAGPFYIVDAANPIDCPEGFARQDLGFVGLTADAPTCDCSCTETAGNCSVETQLSYALCLTGLGGTLQDGGCTNYDALGQDVHLLAELSGNPVSCAPNLQENIPAATWGSASTFCAAPVRGGDCGADACIADSPEGFATSLCISGEGDVECPAGEWGDRTVVYRTFDDKRTCEGCTCAGPAECQAQTSAYNSSGCSGEAQAVSLDTCTDLSVSGDYSVGAAVNNGSCEASSVTAAGEATPDDPVTLCCASVQG